MMDTGKTCEDGICSETGRTEFCGFCAYCWINTLDDEQRQKLLSRYEPDVVQHVIERVRVIYPASTRFRRVALLAWRVGMTVGMGWMMWRVRR
jgi:hypothetical protein